MHTDVYVYAACIALAMMGCASKGKANAMSAAATGREGPTDRTAGALDDRMTESGRPPAAPGSVVEAEATALAPIAGLTRAVAQRPRRVPIRWSENSGSTYAWRLEIGCDQGRGGILRNDSSTPESFHGDGIFAGWSSVDLGKVYRSAVDSFHAPDQAVSSVQLD